METLAEVTQRQVLGWQCTYCQQSTKRVDTSLIYGGKPTGKFAYWCQGCDAYVGCHPGTVISLGTVANECLRKWRMAAHAAFDPLWRTKGAKWTRTAAYAWLSLKLDIPSPLCHMAMMDEAQCRQVIEVSRLKQQNHG